MERVAERAEDLAAKAAEETVVVVTEGAWVAEGMAVAATAAGATAAEAAKEMAAAAKAVGVRHSAVARATEAAEMAEGAWAVAWAVGA